LLRFLTIEISYAKGNQERQTYDENISKLQNKFVTIIVLLFLLTFQSRAEVSIAYRTDSPQLSFAVSVLSETLREVNETLLVHDLADIGDMDILIISGDNETVFLPEKKQTPH